VTLERDLSELTSRELEVLRLLAQVQTHVSRILAKLDLRDRARALVAAYETGLIRPGSAGAPPAG
jgi:DNA-binding NarL/FixJ family response regulator